MYTWWLYIHGDCLCACFCGTSVLSVVNHTYMPQVEEEALVIGNSVGCNWPHLAPSRQLSIHSVTG